MTSSRTHVRKIAKAPERLETPRLVLRRPLASDAEAIFHRYAADREVTRLVGWPAHQSLADTRAFLAWSDVEWQRWPAGPYLVLSRADDRLLGGTGLAFETTYRAATGYVFAKDAWGNGFATETLQGITDVARGVGVRRLYALCHIEHRASWHVLEKCRFEREGILRRYAEFPNLTPSEPCDVLCYAIVL
jgi:ribosomal-protein-alanine N-acetyltransferase